MLRNKIIKSNPDRKEELKSLRKKENLRAKWIKHKLVFIKYRMNPISEVVYLKYIVLIITSRQFDIEHDIKDDKSAGLALACRSPLLQRHIIEKNGLFSEKEAGKNILQGAVQFEGDSDLNSLL